MLGLQSWPCSLLFFSVLLSASVQTVSLPGQRLQMLLSRLLPLEPESTLTEEDTKEGSSFGPQLISNLPFLPSGARAARPSLWRKNLASRNRREPSLGNQHRLGNRHGAPLREAPEAPVPGKGGGGSEEAARRYEEELPGSAAAPRGR